MEICETKNWLHSRVRFVRIEQKSNDSVSSLTQVPQSKTKKKKKIIEDKTNTREIQTDMSTECCTEYAVCNK